MRGELLQLFHPERLRASRCRKGEFPLEHRGFRGGENLGGTKQNNSRWLGLERETHTHTQPLELWIKTGATTMRPISAQCDKSRKTFFFSSQGP